MAKQKTITISIPGSKSGHKIDITLKNPTVKLRPVLQGQTGGGYLVAGKSKKKYT